MKEKTDYVSYCNINFKLNYTWIEENSVTSAFTLFPYLGFTIKLISELFHILKDS